jgi:hypothetical protein
MNARTNITVLENIDKDPQRGYARWLGSQCTELYCAPGGLVGSIG